jgi:hypothetical protein
MCDLKLRVTWIRDRREPYFEKKGQEISPGTIFPFWHGFPPSVLIKQQAHFRPISKKKGTVRANDPLF